MITITYSNFSFALKDDIINKSQAPNFFWVVAHFYKSKVTLQSNPFEKYILMYVKSAQKRAAGHYEHSTYMYVILYYIYVNN